MGLEWPEETLLFVWAIDHQAKEAAIGLDRAYVCAEVFYPALPSTSCEILRNGTLVSMKLPQATCARILRLTAANSPPD